MERLGFQVFQRNRKGGGGNKNGWLSLIVLASGINISTGITVDFRVPVGQPIIGNENIRPLICVKDPNCRPCGLDKGVCCTNRQEPVIEEGTFCWHVHRYQYSCNNVDIPFRSSATEYTFRGFNGTVCLHQGVRCTGKTQTVMANYENQNEWVKSEEPFLSFQTPRCTWYKKNWNGYNRGFYVCSCSYQPKPYSHATAEETAETCVPTEAYGTIQHYDNTEGSVPARVVVSYEVTATDSTQDVKGTHSVGTFVKQTNTGVSSESWSEFSKTSSLSAPYYSGVGHGSLSVRTGVRLQKTFSLSLGLSLTTGYNWAQTRQHVYNSRLSVTHYIDVPVGTRTVIQQLRGKCGPFEVETEMIKRVDYDRTGQAFKSPVIYETSDVGGWTITNPVKLTVGE